MEALARVPSVDIRILSGNPAIGGIDQFQVHDFTIVFAERIAFPIAVTLANAKTSFASRYRKLPATTNNFAVIVPYRDRIHWITIAPRDRTSYYLIKGARPIQSPYAAATDPS